MNRDEKESITTFKVVVNHEEQYSIWPVYRENPLGWRDVAKTGSKDECLAYIKEVWTDMRPLLDFVFIPNYSAHCRCLSCQSCPSTQRAPT